MLETQAQDLQRVIWHVCPPLHERRLRVLSVTVAGVCLNSSSNLLQNSSQQHSLQPDWSLPDARTVTWEIVVHAPVL